MTIAARGIALIAVGFALVYAVLLSPAWEPTLDDQFQYLALAHGLADRAEYTRATAGEPFIPESLRAPGYPVFVAALCRTVGCDHWQIAGAQAALVGLTVLLVIWLARRVMPSRPALVAGAVVALYPTFAYFAALALSETLATFLLVFMVVLLVRTCDAPTPGRALATGLALGALAVTRWLFLPFAAVAIVTLVLRRAPRRLIPPLLIGWALVLAPAVAYSLGALGRPVAGSLGTQLWLGYFQARDPATLDSVERAAAERGRDRIAAFVALADRVDQARSFMALDDALRDEALALVAHAPGQYIARAAQRSFELWAGDRPYPRAAQENVPLPVQVFLATFQIVLLAAGFVGTAVLAWRRHPVGLAAVLAVLVLWISSAPLWTEPRFSLPVKPLLIVGATWLFTSRRAAPSAADASAAPLGGYPD